MNEDNIKQPTAQNNVPVIKQAVNTLLPVINKVKVVWMKIPDNIKKILRIVIIVLAALFLLMVVFSAVMKYKSNLPVEVQPSPIVYSEPPSDEEIVTNPSRYATDSGVLEIEENLRNLDKELDNLKVNEINLLPPRLDFDITFDI